MRKKNLEVFQQAVGLASTGKYDGWKDIQKELVGKGYDRATDLLAGDKIRTMLDLQCSNARQRSKK